MNLSWTPAVGATSYNVYRSVSSGSLGTKIASPTASVYQDRSVTNGTNYNYAVTSVSATGESSACGAIEACPQVAAPGAPMMVSAASGDAQAIIQWTPGTASTSSNLYYSTNPTFTPSTGTKIAGATSPFTQRGLVNGTPYYWIVTAVNAGGEVASSRVSAIPQVSAPGAPSSVGIASGDAQVTISWTPGTGSTSSNLYYSPQSTMTTSTGIKISAATSPYTLTGLVNGTTYYWIVTSVNAGGEVASVRVSATPQVPAPGAPTNVSATGGNAQATISWTDGTGSSSSNIYYSTNSAFTTTTGTKIAGVTSPYTRTGLNNGTKYYWIVTALNGGGEVPSAKVSATPQVPPPSPPSGLSASVGNANATLSWTAAPGATSYNLYYSTSPGVTAASGTKVANITSPYTHNGLTNGTTYYWVVTAVNAGGEVPSSQVTGSPLAPPEAPTGVAASAGNRTVTISWDPSGNATSYNLYWSYFSGVTPVNGTKIANVTSPYTATGLSNGNRYYWIVTAVNAGGQTASSQVSATPVYPPSAPSTVTVANGTNQMTVSWGSVTDALSYNLYWSSSPGVTVGTGTKISNATSPYTVTGLPAGTIRYFVATAVNAGGESPASSQVVGQTHPYWSYLGGPQLASGTDDRAFAMDGDVPYLAYSDSSDQTFTVRRYSGGVWSTVISASTSGSDGPYFNFKVKDGMVYLATWQQVYQAIGSAWIQLGTGTLRSGVLGLDPNGVLYVASTDITTNKVFVQKYVSGSWVPVGNQLPITMGTARTLRIGNSGTVYLGVADTVTSGMNVGGWIFSYDGASWQQLGSTSFPVGGPFSIVLDPSEVPYVGVNLHDGGKVMKYVSGTWQDVGAGTFPTGARNMSLAVDPTGRPLVSYVEYNDYLYYANVVQFNGTAWVPMGLQNFSSMLVTQTEMATDTTGKPYVFLSESYSPSVMTFQ